MAEALQDAIVSKDAEFVSSLLSTSPNLINKVCPDGRTPLNTAIARGADVIVPILLSAGADINLPDSFRVDCACLRPVHYAARHNNINLVRHFLSCDVDVDQPDEGDSTPLHHATTWGNFDLVVYLVEAGSDINWQSHSGRTPLWKAAEHGYRDLTQVLYAMGAALNLPNKVGENVLFELITKDCLLPIVTDLLELGIDVNWRDIEGSTVLHKACTLGKVDAARMLIESGADGTTQNEYGNTPLHNAAMYDHTSLIVLLLNNYDLQLLTTVNRLGQSALFFAMVHQHADAVRILHDVGARLSLKELNFYRDHETQHRESKRKFWIWCSKLFRTPKNLSALCVVVIRKNTKSPIIKTSKELPIPKYLRKLVLVD